MAGNSGDISFEEKRKSRQFLLGLLVGGVGTILSGVLVALIVSLLAPVVKGVLWPQPAPRPAQLEEIRHEIASSGGRTLLSKEADLHGTNVRSQILVLTNRGGGTELWIFDEEDGWLRNEFRFRPGHVPPLFDTLPGRYGMEVTDVSDLDGDGAEEIVLSLLPRWKPAKGRKKVLGGGEPIPEPRPFRLVNSRLQIPLLIRWDQGEGRYRLQPLISQEPRYPLPPRVSQSRARSDFYRRPFWMLDPETDTRQRVYGALEARVMQNGTGQPFLLTAYPVRWRPHSYGLYGFSFLSRCRPLQRLRGTGVLLQCVKGKHRVLVLNVIFPWSAPDVLSLVAGRIDTAGAPLVRSCTDGDTFFIKTGFDPARATRRAWRRLLLRSAC